MSFIIPYSILTLISLILLNLIAWQIISNKRKQYNGVPLRNSFIRRLVFNKTRIEISRKHWQPNIFTEGYRLKTTLGTELHYCPIKSVQINTILATGKQDAVFGLIAYSPPFPQGCSVSVFLVRNPKTFSSLTTSARRTRPYSPKAPAPRGEEHPTPLWWSPQHRCPALPPSPSSFCFKRQSGPRTKLPQLSREFLPLSIIDCEDEAEFSPTPFCFSPRAHWLGSISLSLKQR